MTNNMDIAGKEPQGDLIDELAVTLCSTLGLAVGAIEVDPNTPVLGAIPEMDSMSVVNFLMTLEEHYDISIDDAEIEASIFETLGSIALFVEMKLG